MADSEQPQEVDVPPPASDAVEPTQAVEGDAPAATDGGADVQPPAEESSDAPASSDPSAEAAPPTEGGDQPPAATDPAASASPVDATPVDGADAPKPEGGDEASAVPTSDSIAAPNVAAPAADAAKPTETPNVDFDFLKRKDKYIRPNTHLPEDAEFALAKAFLMQTSEKSQMNLYDHLSMTVMRVLETRPLNAVDFFESISSEIKRSKFPVDPIRAQQPPLPDTTQADIQKVRSQLKLFEKPLITSDEDSADAPQAGEIPDILDLSHLWEWAGVSFGKEETFKIFLGLKKLAEEKPLKSVRLWGKILGLEGSYLVAEGELREGAVDEDDAIANPEPGKENAEGDTAAAAEGEVAPVPPAEGGETVEGGEDGAAPVKKEGEEEDDMKITKPKTGKVLMPLPKENRTGVNKYVYYVCSYPGAPWTRLPDVTPEHLQAARKIRKYFTGNLTHTLNSHPAFPYSEAHYLRCQVARISAATVASPAGYYTFDPEEEAPEDDSQYQQTIIINPEFEGLPNEALTQLSNWVHHVPYILPQGRVTWENPYKTVTGSNSSSDGTEGESEEDGGSDAGSDSEDSSGSEAVEPESGPPILSLLSSDAESADGTPAWVSKPCSLLSPSKFSPAMLRSTRWPGAMVVAYNDKFCNLYVGDGLRELDAEDGLYVPTPLPPVQSEYVIPVEVREEDSEEDKAKALEAGRVWKEQVDPTVEEEEAFEEAKKAKEEDEKEEGEEEEGEGEPEAEEED
ncbi:Radial spoke head protein 4 A [Chytridiales sp. JEL 0842]|nr:Radial spoke head protein 4 A [Chytridiales sp. JEL 0842]